MIALKSSGSSLAESAVDPTRSQNSTVSCRRSIGRESRAVGTTAGGSTRNLVPQSPQNLLGAGCRATGQTAPHYRRSALPTEFLLLRDFGCAIRALHPDL